MLTDAMSLACGIRMPVAPELLIGGNVEPAAEYPEKASQDSDADECGVRSRVCFPARSICS